MAENVELNGGEIINLSNIRIYFGHQSVGYNIIDGIIDYNPDIKILELRSVHDERTFFLHSQVGKNQSPESKINDFSEIVDGLNGKIDVAFLKFCYIDITDKTDINELFNSYKESIDNLKNKYPDIIFVHFTAPLTAIQRGAKAFVKKILGRPVGYEDNFQRQRYNELIRNEYTGIEPVFDIAEIESTISDGRRVSHKRGGYVYFSMSDSYTNDGGHLNEEGRLIVAKKLIEMLSELN